MTPREAAARQRVITREEAARIEREAWDDVERVVAREDARAGGGSPEFGGVLAIATAVFRAHASRDLHLPPWSRG